MCVHVCVCMHVCVVTEGLTNVIMTGTEKIIVCILCSVVRVVVHMCGIFSLQ